MRILVNNNSKSRYYFSHTSKNIIGTGRDSLAILGRGNKELKDRVKKIWSFYAYNKLNKLAYNAVSSSPFTGLGAFGSGPFQGKFTTNYDAEKGRVNMWARVPNIIFIDGVSAPYHKYYKAKKYTFFNSGHKGKSKTGFFTTKKAQTLAGTDGADKYFFDSKSEPVGFFTAKPKTIPGGNKGLILGRSVKGDAGLVYYNQNYAEWLYENFGASIIKIVDISKNEAIQRALNSK